MSDIVDRLRDGKGCNIGAMPLLQEAADEIERLATLLGEFVQAFDTGAVELSSADIEIDAGCGHQIHPFHEEWLHHVRRALEGLSTGA